MGGAQSFGNTNFTVDLKLALFQPFGYKPENEVRKIVQNYLLYDWMDYNCFQPFYLHVAALPFFFSNNYTTEENLF